MRHNIPLEVVGTEPEILVLGAGFVRETPDVGKTTHTDRFPCEGQRRLELLDIPWHLDDEDPIPTGTYDVVIAHNVFEHLPHIELENGQDAFIAVMNEAHRVLRIGGVLDIELPNARSLLAITHPGHRRLFVPQTFAFFLTPKHIEHWMETPPGAWDGYPIDYHIELWDRLDFEQTRDGSLFLFMLQKPDPSKVDWNSTPVGRWGSGNIGGGHHG